MKKKSLIGLALLALLAGAAALAHRVAFAKEAPAYRFVEVEKGDVEATVSATGTLGAVKTVQVGTQVSGQVSGLFVDFNDRVKKGQLLARIDPTLQEQAVADAQAALERAQAQVLQARREDDRNAALAAEGLVARSEAEKTDSSLDVARANLKSAQVALDRARRNLQYTSIYAPIDGVVVERNVDVGQTVAASLSAPQLFLIAEDLTSMQILARVGESDIAGIREGQPVTFTVQALTGRRFEGRVEQVRLQSTTSENVVNYTVVISVPNEERRLLPGMTARVNFLTDSASGVLKVANAALRFKPEQEVAAAAPQQAGDAQPGAPQRRRARRPREGAAARSGGSGTLYYLDAEGQMKAMRVRTGLSDGSFTEVRGRELVEGTRVIAGLLQPDKAENTASNPFGSSSSRSSGPRPPGGF